MSIDDIPTLQAKYLAPGHLIRRPGERTWHEVESVRAEPSLRQPNVVIRTVDGREFLTYPVTEWPTKLPEASTSPIPGELVSVAVAKDVG